MGLGPGLGGLPLALAGGPVVLAVGLVLTIPVLLALANVRTTEVVSRPVLTQAFAWLNTASVAGSASAAAVAGWVIDRGGARHGLLMAAAATLAVALLARAPSTPRRRTSWPRRRTAWPRRRTAWPRRRTS